MQHFRNPTSDAKTEVCCDPTTSFDMEYIDMVSSDYKNFSVTRRERYLPSVHITSL